jgi:hypothetical protein
MDTNFYLPRKLLFKAWNKETKLLMRLDSMECVKGELVKKDHILLQFTGMYDKAGEELYEMDLVLKGTEKFVITWDGNPTAWTMMKIEDRTHRLPLTHALAKDVTRLCSYFESEKR